jgi:hypothetical protein
MRIARKYRAVKFEFLQEAHLIEHNIPFLLFSDDEHIEELIKPH